MSQQTQISMSFLSAEINHKTVLLNGEILLLKQRTARRRYVIMTTRDR